MSPHVPSSREGATAVTHVTWAAEYPQVRCLRVGRVAQGVLSLPELSVTLSRSGSALSLALSTSGSAFSLV